jgi:hypothetical protein
MSDLTFDVVEQELTVEELKEVEQLYQDFWSELVETDGRLDPAKVKRELYDWYNAMNGIAIVYCELTGSRISKPLTDHLVIIEQIEAHFERLYG